LLSAAEAQRVKALGGVCAPSRGGLRRVVASPAPLRILEERSLRLLLDAGAVVVCGGGGGIPVARGPDGRLSGVEAVIDKDRSAALLADVLGADGLLLLTDVPAVYADWPARSHPIRLARASELAERSFERGSMAPKVEAACRFARLQGRRAWIGALEEASAIVRGEAGTAIGGERAALEPSAPAAPAAGARR
jgi:carbamate kinase